MMPNAQSHDQNATESFLLAFLGLAKSYFKVFQRQKRLYKYESYLMKFQLYNNLYPFIYPSYKVRFCFHLVSKPVGQ